MDVQGDTIFDNGIEMVIPAEALESNVAITLTRLDENYYENNYGYDHSCPKQM